MSVTQLNDMLPNRRQMTVEDDEFISVSEGRIRIRIGVVIFMCVLILVILRLAEVSLLGDKISAALASCLRRLRQHGPISLIVRVRF